jgi:hypothetical protein
VCSAEDASPYLVQAESAVVELHACTYAGADVGTARVDYSASTASQRLPILRPPAVDSTYSFGVSPYLLGSGFRRFSGSNAVLETKTDQSGKATLQVCSCCCVCVWAFVFCFAFLRSSLQDVCVCVVFVCVKCLFRPCVCVCFFVLFFYYVCVELCCCSQIVLSILCSSVPVLFPFFVNFYR